MIRLFKPDLAALSFRQKLLADPETMAYNRAWGGTIDFSPERWQGFFARWIDPGEPDRFFRYLYDDRCGPVGEVSYHRREEDGLFLCDVLVLSAYRGRGYGRAGLRLLCDAARQNGVSVLTDEIAADNPSAALFLSAGFREVARTDTVIRVSKTL